MRKLFTAVFALIVLPTAALAQEVPSEKLRSPSLRIGAGAAVPVSDGLSFFHQPGPSLAAGLDVPISERLDVTLDVGYTRLLLDDDQITRLFEAAAGSIGANNLNFEISGGANHLIVGTAGLRWTFATPGQAALYLSGGTGLFYSSIGDPDVDARDTEGNDVAGDASLRSSEEGVSFGFDLGVGTRLPLAAGVDLFLEPRYALFLSDSHYFSARAGLAFDGLFDAAPTRQRRERARAPRRYEVSTSYRGTFFGDGDETGAAYRAGVARRLFSSRTGLALAGAYRRAVDTDLDKGLQWKKRRGVAADLVFFVDALRFETGRVAHRLRVGAGPAVRRQWGEQPRAVLTADPGQPREVERLLKSDSYDRARRFTNEDGRTRYLFTEEFDETQWGSAVKLEYVLDFGHVTVGPSAGYWYYGEGSPAMSYGLQIGVPFSKTLK